jgi:nitrite reductase (NADH) small subunit
MWIDVCALDDVVPDAAVCALVRDRQVALVRVGDRVFALDNFDPFSRAFVISRGIVGDKRGVPVIASPIYKHAFDLRSGASLDDPSVKLRTFDTRVRLGRVEIRDE